MSALKPVTILRRARKLIENPERWVKGMFVQYPGAGIGPCYCAVGALNAAAGCTIDDASVLSAPTRTQSARTRAYKALQAATGRVHIPRWNDRPSTSHAHVLKAFDKAIAQLS